MTTLAELDALLDPIADELAEAVPESLRDALADALPVDDCARTLALRAALAGGDPDAADSTLVATVAAHVTATPPCWRCRLALLADRGEPLARAWLVGDAVPHDRATIVPEDVATTLDPPDLLWRLGSAASTTRLADELGLRPEELAARAAEVGRALRSQAGGWLEEALAAARAVADLGAWEAAHVLTPGLTDSDEAPEGVIAAAAGVAVDMLLVPTRVTGNAVEAPPCVVRLEERERGGRWLTVFECRPAPDTRVRSLRIRLRFRPAAEDGVLAEDLGLARRHLGVLRAALGEPAFTALLDRLVPHRVCELREEDGPLRFEVPRRLPGVPVAYTFEVDATDDVG